MSPCLYAADEAIPPADNRKLRATLPLTHSLAGRLIKIVFACYFLVTLVVTGVQLGLEYRDADRRLHQSVAAMLPTFGPGIADAMWRFNGDVLHGILAGMMQMPTVVGLDVRDESGRRMLAFGTVRDADGRLMAIKPNGTTVPDARQPGFLNRVFSQTFDVVHTDETGGRQTLGTWTVYSDEAIILAQLKGEFVVVLIDILIKTLALGTILLVVIHRTIGRPLRQLGAFVGQLNIDNLGVEPFVLRDKGRHELHMLAGTLNLMTAKLRTSVEDNTRLFHELQDMNTTLQAKVAERTRELERLAGTDLLTGLWNRRRLDDIFNREAVRAAVGREPLAVILGDVDAFKAVNDLHGHPVGDSVLETFAALLKSGVRPSDAVGRWGGEEFLIVCPRTDLAAGAALAERLRRQVETADFPVVGTKTCSFGVAEMIDGDTVGAMLARADAALYRAKQAGRNRVVRSDEDAAPPPVLTPVLRRA